MDMEVCESDGINDGVMEGCEDGVVEPNDTGLDDHSIMIAASVIRRKGYYRDAERLELLADSTLDSDDFDASPAYIRRFQSRQEDDIRD
jgi:hypothetical protein